MSYQTFVAEIFGKEYDLDGIIFYIDEVSKKKSNQKFLYLILLKIKK